MSVVDCGVLSLASGPRSDGTSNHPRLWAPRVRFVREAVLSRRALLAAIPSTCPRSVAASRCRGLRMPERPCSLNSFQVRKAHGCGRPPTSTQDQMCPTRAPFRPRRSTHVHGHCCQIAVKPSRPATYPRCDRRSARAAPSSAARRSSAVAPSHPRTATSGGKNHRSPNRAITHSTRKDANPIAAIAS